MAAYRRNLYAQTESLNREEFVFAKYIVTASTMDYLKLAGEIAVEQTCGTWTKVPGETDELVKRHGGKVVSAFEVPDYTYEVHEGPRTFILEIAFPVINFGSQIPMLLTTVIGNISMMGSLKLVDLVFPKSFTDAFPGPRFGVEGLRKYLSVEKRPLTNCMIKPCAGLSPKQTGEMFFESAMGGIDIVKDDELIANASYSSVVDRVKECMAAEKRAFEETGEHTYYAVNVTDTPNRLLDNAKAALDAGVNMIMVNYLTAGFGTVRMLAEMDEVNVPLMTHPDFAGSYSWAPMTGMSAHLVLGKLARLVGTDIAVYPISHGKIPHTLESHIKVAMALQDDFAGKKPVWPMPGGGAHAGMTEILVDELGNDVILGCGAAVHAHPLGSRAGARALRQSIDAVMEGIPLREAAEDLEELRIALDTWGVAGEKEIFGLKQ